MPLISRIMVRLALLYLVVGASIGALMLANKAIIFYPAIWRLLPIHIELMIFGWIIQFTIGTAYWMLPRVIIGEPRGNAGVAFLIPLLLNVGIICVIVSLVSGQFEWLELIGRVMETTAIPIFIVLHWKRVSKQLHEE